MRAVLRPHGERGPAAAVSQPSSASSHPHRGTKHVTKTILGTPAPLPADCSHMKHPNENNQGASQLCRAKPHNCCYCKSMRFGDAFKNAAINN